MMIMMMMMIIIIIIIILVVVRIGKERCIHGICEENSGKDLVVAGRVTLK
jgi:hypothetical protein